MRLPVRALILPFLFLFAGTASAHDEGGCTFDSSTLAVRICTPTTGATVTSPVHLAAAADSSAGVTAMKVYVDSVAVHTTSASSLTLHLSMATGSRRISVNAWDRNGAVASRTITINVVQSSTGCSGSTIPSVTICSPLNGSTVSSPVHLIATANDSVRVNTMKVYVDGTSAYQISGNKIDTNLPMAAGAHRITVAAWNANGVTYRTTINITVNSTAVAYTVQSWKTSLSFPVAMAFTPDGRMFYTEWQTGRIRVIKNGVLLSEPFATLPIMTGGERGLLGIAVHPQFTTNKAIYVFRTATSGVNQIVRLIEHNDRAIEQTVIVDNLPAGNYHNAGNIGFGKDGKLYISIGDNNVPSNAQSLSSKAGKILRYNTDGTIPADNPYGASSPLFNLGLRNSFDFAFHPSTGVIYASENGPNCDDELNRILAGKNYGWRPNYPCGDADPSYVAPLVRWSPPIAPTGVGFYTKGTFPQWTGGLLMADYNDGRIHFFRVDEANAGRIVESRVIVNGGYGQIMDVVQGPDGFIYFCTGSAIFRIVPQ